MPRLLYICRGIIIFEGVMMTLHELKMPFQKLYNTVDDTYKELSSEELVELLDDENYTNVKNQIFSILIYRSWQALVNIFYKQQNTSLTEEECYDIFLEAFYYVTSTKPWKKAGNSLNNDKDAFIKAMMQCTSSRKINHIIAQHRQKRILNCNTMSIDALNEDFQEGYFSHYYDSYKDTDSGSLYSLIREFFDKKSYLISFILDAILTLDIYTEDNDLDIRRLRKYLRSLSTTDCNYFATTYNLNFNEVEYSLKYFQNLSTEKLTNKINECIMSLKENSIIREAIKC